MEIRNKTKRPLKVPLPGGKKLFLGPGRTGQITSKAADHPPVQKMIEAEEIEILGGGHSPGQTGAEGGSGLGSSQGHSSGGSVRHTGDR